MTQQKLALLLCACAYPPGQLNFPNKNLGFEFRSDAVWCLHTAAVGRYHCYLRPYDERSKSYQNCCCRFDPAKIVSPFLCTAPSQYIPKILLTQATINCLTNNKTKNPLHVKTIISTYIDGEPSSHSLCK